MKIRNIKNIILKKLEKFQSEFSEEVQSTINKQMNTLFQNLSEQIEKSIQNSLATIHEKVTKKILFLPMRYCVFIETSNSRSKMFSNFHRHTTRLLLK